MQRSLGTGSPRRRAKSLEPENEFVLENAFGIQHRVPHGHESDPRRFLTSPQAVRSAHVGHIGCSLSVADILCSLYGGVLRAEVDDPERDRFVLSKGHAALALYAVLGLKGLISPDQTSTYCIGQTMLGVHPEHKLTGVDFCTGSLGMGLSMATGAALAARLQKSPRRVSDCHY
jgi:transketolase N-terminal domain/subunit